MITARQLAEALLALPDPDVPVCVWAPGQYWEPIPTPAFHQVGSAPYSYAMIEVNACERVDVTEAAIATFRGKR